MNQQEFQILFTTADYKKLEQQCKLQEKTLQESSQENKILNQKLFHMNNENTELRKKITKLNENINFLSQKGLQLSRCLVEGSSSSYKTMSSFQSSQGRNSCPALESKYEEINEINQSIFYDLAAKQPTHEQSNSSTVEDEVLSLQSQLQKMKIASNQQLQEHKIQQKKQQLLIHSLEKKLVEIEQNYEKLSKEKEEIILNHAQSQKKYNAQIQTLEQQISMRKGKGKGNALQQLKQQIETYFSNLVIGLHQMGGMENEEIKLILESERSHLIDTMNVYSSLQNMKIKK